MADPNLTLRTDFYEHTMMQGYCNEKSKDTVIFAAFTARIPLGTGMP